VRKTEMPSKPARSTAPGALALTTIAMLAFAGNSLLCRMALGPGLLDAASFTTVRVLSGAALLGVLAFSGGRRPRRTEFDPRAVLALAAYMLCFSFAYRSLTAGTGALLLFGAVQLTMFAAALRAGERLPVPGWLGVALAVLGLGYLVAPGVTAPDPVGAVLMATAGAAWGVYSLLGRAGSEPLRTTALNFVGAVAIVGLVSVATLGKQHWTAAGLLLAIASGTLTSGVGYVVWYAALRQLSTSGAAIVQLSVPVIAALGGAVLLAEPVGWRLVLASIATLGGIAIVLGVRLRGR
jgi:drug/metabolite transporter (DMT)-like permease